MAVSYRCFSDVIRNSILFFILFFCANSYAVLLDFDELNPDDFLIDPEDVLPGDYYREFLGDHYRHEGVIFLGAAFVLPWPDGRPQEPSSAPNYIGGPEASINFIGDLPTFVSLVVFNFLEVQTTVSANGPNNYYNSISTSGMTWGMMDDDLSTPYIHNQLVSFYSPTGISEIWIRGRMDISFDDLTFTYASSVVDEPPSLLIFVSYFFILALFKLKRRIL